MIAKIGKGSNLIGALSYNQLKVEKRQASILLLHNLPDTFNDSSPVSSLYKYFEPYLLLNNKTEKVVRHISLNPNPTDILNDDELSLIAEEFLTSMEYEQQPYVVYKHSDIDREHIHIVTVCTDLEGKKINDKYDHLKSMKTCREIEKKFKLTTSQNPPTDTKRIQFKPVDYRKHDLKSQIASVIRYLPKHYHYDSLSSYNALLSLFNIRAEKVETSHNGQAKIGMVYLALNEVGEKASNPFKSSLFGKNTSYPSLELQFQKSKEELQNRNIKSNLKDTIEIAFNMSISFEELKKTLIEEGINVVLFKNKEDRIYGVTFIDHNSKGVYKGSHLSKSLSANAFHEKFKNDLNEDPETKSWKLSKDNNVNTIANIKDTSISNSNLDIHPLFNYLNAEKMEYNENEFVPLFNLISSSQDTDFEELQFEQKMKQKKRRRL